MACRNETATSKARHKIGSVTINTGMRTFYEWIENQGILVRLRLIETYFSFDPAEYNRVFEDELAKVIRRVSDPAHRAALDRMQGFNWVGYIAAAIRQAGWRDQREIQERTHDLVTKLLIGTLFRGFNEKVSGPMDLRFKRSVGNGVRNLAEKERNRRRHLPSVPIGQEFEPGGITADELPGRRDSGDEKVIEDFRQLVRSRMGQMGLAVFDARMAGQEMKALAAMPEFGGKNRLKRIVQQIKGLATEFAQALGDPEFVRGIARAMEREGATVAKRLATTAAGRAQ